MATNPTLLTMPIAENGQKNTIPATQAAAGDGLLSQSTGFPPETALPLGAGGKAPTREDFNGAFNLLSDIAFYAQKGWMFNFDAGQSYFAGCIVRDATDGNLYECLNDVAAGGSVPSADSTNWKAFSTGGGVAVGFIMPYAGTGLQEGWLDCDGSAVSRTMYPDLFAAIGTTWGAGDGSTTFNLPRSEDLVLQGASATNPVGTYLQAGLPNIEGGKNGTSGAFEFWTNLPASSPVGTEYDAGAFSTKVTQGGVTTYTAYSGAITNLTFDASNANSIYGNSDTVQPPAACVRYMIKAFDGQTPDSALIDITQYAADLANKADRSLSNLTATGEDHFLAQDFTIIYPNGGTAANPANITQNSRYVEVNPYTGYIVYCVAEVYDSAHDVWGDSFWYDDHPGIARAWGVRASQLSDGTIVVQTGMTGVINGTSSINGTGLNFGGVDQTSLPCRVKVFKIGKAAR